MNGDPAMSAIEEKLEKGKEQKDRGNGEFKKGNLVEALRFYHHATLYLNGLDNAGAAAFVPSKPLEAGQKKEIKETLNACYGNMAACYLKQNNYEKCIKTCSKIIDSEPTAKAYFRRGLSHLELNAVEEALKDLKKAVELAPQDKGIREGLARAHAKEKEMDEKDKAAWRGKLKP
ncbi:uncharacterized protein EV422DRAFT_547320 [Fimicolochytrium jonesii]|uniref:uncharacterized protein n=1 Tax=Fimicolochytrium jonesii TaxID=1396493 RepID=UPI0022FE7DB0|nr:uncharacterized protein EV422DRAFT_547320 [Fimicolochytrium jonesii]KAI8816102.1 hypothetical protein EV422DRAFT_547320 [Fimicolochytrium jonesii]